jgi:hypothetical protein
MFTVAPLGRQTHDSEVCTCFLYVITVLYSMLPQEEKEGA